MSAQFDKYAKDYRDMHAGSVAASGEEPEYFHRYKAEWLQARFGAAAGPVLDFGAGIGNLTRELTPLFDEVHGYDPSRDSLDMARERAPGATFFAERAELPAATYAVAILANVLHHVAPAERVELVQFVASRLKPGGALVLWEHNPMNPLTRKAVRDCPFDEDAILLWPSELRSLQNSAGTRNLRRDWVVFFPAALSKLRFLERSLRLCPLGAQCVVTGERP